VLYYGAVEAIDAFTVNDCGGIFFVSRLKTNFIIRLEKNSLEGRFMRHCETDKAVIAIMHFGGG
jgi:hypothetical protein